MFNGKRGQITVFIILGIIIVAVIGFTYFIFNERTKQIKNDVEFDESKLQPLKEYIESCIKVEGEKALDLIGKQGGDIEPGLYQYYFDNKISYLCYTDSFTPCFDRRPNLIEHMENELKNHMASKLGACIDFGEIKKAGFKVEHENKINISVSVGKLNTIMNLDYPITITKGNTIVKENRFSHTFNVPLGRLAEVSKDGVEEEINIGDFFTIPYMLRHQGEIEIERQEVRDSKIYILKLRDDPYKFQYAVRSYVKK
ncbi:hypothetical protein J4214_00630 [Candidatus Woesearchaeota archaeon]|nr:hypothetical protein [Candidatus Woesearchaeota archaeon]